MSKDTKDELDFRRFQILLAVGVDSEAFAVKLVAKLYEQGLTGQFKLQSIVNSTEGDWRLAVRQDKLDITCTRDVVPFIKGQSEVLSVVGHFNWTGICLGGP